MTTVQRAPWAPPVDEALVERIKSIPNVEELKYWAVISRAGRPTPVIARQHEQDMDNLVLALRDEAIHPDSATKYARAADHRIYTEACMTVPDPYPESPHQALHHFALVDFLNQETHHKLTRDGWAYACRAETIIGGSNPLEQRSRWIFFNPKKGPLGGEEYDAARRQTIGGLARKTIEYFVEPDGNKFLEPKDRMQNLRGSLAAYIR